ncbi:hypothetical protein E2F48_10950 [Arthrobacter crusticola]|uniref:Uncharacterized protein n=1 Tax=Arthrobacter crusticola TaxID=2547960 RepID=A0A4R5TX50_9MICC|nr:hypothetical protein [Arthrobacter crusticola]TDK25747.1 hypothetical protein E2F48_10950 [Arthrobacter crusticola]
MQITLSPMPAERPGPWLAGSMSTYIDERMRSGETTAIQLKKQPSGQDARADADPFVTTKGTHR